MNITKAIWMATVLMLSVQCNVFAEENKVYNRKKFESEGSVIWEVPMKEKLIALTFDDGPDPAYTPRLLDVLKQSNVKATFFVLGRNVEHHPKIVARMVKEGHQVSNHTYNHPKLGKLNADQMKDELWRTEALLRQYRTDFPALLRPPTGQWDPRIVKEVSKLGFVVTLWSWDQDTYDWQDPGVSTIVKRIMDGLSPGDIVIMHDAGGNRNQTIAAVKAVLPLLKSKGYRCVTVDQLLYHHPVYEKIKNEQLYKQLQMGK
ncbi:MAG: polysaccharide deacetylase family protein [Bacilli bacterium]